MTYRFEEDWVSGDTARKFLLAINGAVAKRHKEGWEVIDISGQWYYNQQYPRTVLLKYRIKEKAA